jgi:hypothetical protein
MMARFGCVLVWLVAVNSAAAFAPTTTQNGARSLALRMTTESAAKDPVKVGVIGCGRIGIVHLGAINKAPGVIPVIVSNPTISKAENGKCMLMMVSAKLS